VAHAFEARARRIEQEHPRLLPRQPAPACHGDVEGDAALVAYGPEARRPPAEAAHSADGGDPALGSTGHLRERRAAGADRSLEAGLEDAAPGGAAGGAEPGPARQRRTLRVEHQTHALPAPPAAERRGELHLPVAARRRAHVAALGLEPAPDEV